MSVTPEPCPGTWEIERLAGGDGAGAGVEAHVSACGSCRARLEAARDDARFLGRVRALTAPTLGPEGMPRIAGYQTLGVLNAGAQGVVYRAVQESTSRTVAIKTLRRGEGSTERQRYRAEREAEVAARLRHPNVVTVFESRSLSDGSIAVVMEYVDGVPLDKWRPPGDTGEARLRAVLGVFIAVCNGVQHAHLNGVIHRDLKPENILVTAEGRPVVLDFGIARLGTARMTLTGEFAGTPAYASPEQASGRSESVDALTDVYSLGVILYRLLCAAMPYDVSGSFFEVVRAITEAPPTPPRRHNPAIAPDLEAIVLRTIHKDKALRYQSAAGLARDIERFLAGDPVDARSGSGWYLLRKALLVNRRRLAWAGAAALIVVGAGIAVALSLADAAREREQARSESVRARAVTELLREALPYSDPERPELASAIGAGLGRLYLRLETGSFAADPEMDQALRRLWGAIYTDLGAGKAAGLIEYSEVSLRSGLVRLRREHGAEHPEIAATLHELAGVLLARKRAPEAERACAEAMEMRERLLGAGSLPAAQTRALLARIRFALGHETESAETAEAALAVLRSIPGHESDPLVASMVALRARALMNAGDFAGAEPLALEALVLRLRTLPPHDADLHVSLADAAELGDASPGGALAGALSAAWGVPPGELSGAVARSIVDLSAPSRSIEPEPGPPGPAEALGRLLEIQRILLGKDDLALVGTLVARMRAAEVAHLLDVKATSAIAAADILGRRFGEESLMVRVCMEQAALSFAFAGRGEESIACGRRVCAIWDAIPESERDPLMAASSRRWLAWYLALAGRCEESVEAYRGAIDDLTRVVGPEHHTVALARAGLAFCLLEQGDAPGAEAHSAGALALAERLPSTPPDQLGNIRFARGHVLLAAGRHAEARDLLERAWDPTFRHAGVRFPLRRVFIADIVGACTALGDAGAAEVWRAQVDMDSGVVTGAP